MRNVEFGSLFQFIRNGMNIKQDKSGDGIPVTRIETIASAIVDPLRVGFAGLTDGDCSGWLLEKGDILFSHINSVEHVGKCAVYRGMPEKLAHGMNLLRLRCDEAQLLPEFAKHLIRSQRFRTKLSSYINKAVNQASVSIGNLKSIAVNIPSLPDQRRIAAILDQADALRAKRREALAQLDSLTQSIFIEMFGDPAVNADWASIELQDAADVLTGFAFKSEQYVTASDASIKLCRGANVMPDRFDWSDLASWPISNADALSEFQLQIDDIVMAMDRPWISEGFKLAKISREDRPSLLVQRVSRIRGKNNVANAYLYELLKQPAFTRHCRPTVTTIPHISPREIRSFTFKLPPEKLRGIFVERIRVAHEVKAKSAQSITQLDNLFASLQHRAFRGEL